MKPPKPKPIKAPSRPEPIDVKKHVGVPKTTGHRRGKKG